MTGRPVGGDPPGSGAAVEVRVDEERRRFIIDTNAGQAYAEYLLNNGVLTLTHTEVPRRLAGGGLGSRLVTWVLDRAREQGHAVAPLCPYVAAFIRRHPEYADLVPEKLRYMIR